MSTSIYEMERNRLKLYGEVLKNESEDRRKKERQMRQENIKNDSMLLNSHIENTRNFEISKKKEQKQVYSAIQEENMQLSKLKRSFVTNNQQSNHKDFIKELEDADTTRLGRLKNELLNQQNEQYYQSSSKKNLEEKIKQVEQEQERRHISRVAQQQDESKKNYFNILNKHQQNMNIYDKHKKLIELNDQYRENLESFTQHGEDIISKIKRNEYMQRKNNLLKNQEIIQQQMEELEKKKVFEKEYLKKNHDLANSMLGSVMYRKSNFDPASLSQEIKHQIEGEQVKKRQQITGRKAKQEINAIYGGVPTRQREQMIKNIDKRLGLEDEIKRRNLNNSYSNEIKIYNPQISAEMRKYSTPKSRGSKQDNKVEERTNLAQSFELENTYKSQASQPPPNIFEDTNNPKASSSTNNKKYFVSYDVVSGRNRYYGQN